MTSEQEARKLLFKYNEDLILDEVRDYIKSTYGEHYAGGGKNIQIQDVFEQMDISEEFRIGRSFSNVYIIFVYYIIMFLMGRIFKNHTKAVIVIQ